MKTCQLVGCSAIGIMLASGAASGQAAFTPLGDLTGGAFFSQARGVSGDGAVVVGSSTGSGGDEAFRWTAGGGMAAIGDLSGGTTSSVGYGVSADGSVVLGAGTPGSGFREATRWTSASGFTPASLGFALSGGYISVSYACSADGLAACGENTFAPASGGGPPPLPITQAMRWTASGGMVDLGTLPGVTPGPAHVTSARGMSADGNVVVGHALDASSTYRPWRWTSVGGIVDISQGQWSGFARGVSPDGNVVVGSRSLGATSEGFKWTAAGGRIELGLIAGYPSSAGLDATSDGRRVCGSAFGSGTNLAVVWDEGLGWRSVSSELAAAGVSTAGWTLQFATAMSDDGTVLVGYGLNPSGQTEAFRAVVPRPCRADFNGIGGVTVQDIFDYLAAYFANLPSADINGVGGVTVQDIFDYLALYFAGCP